jgi:hypothetical protein
MPYEIRKNGRAYEVVNSDTGEVHAKHTTKAKAEAQVKLLQGEDHGFNPDKVKTINGTTYNIKYKNKEQYSGTK